MEEDPPSGLPLPPLTATSMLCRPWTTTPLPRRHLCGSTANGWKRWGWINRSPWMSSTNFSRLLKKRIQANVGEAIPLTAANPADLRIGLLPNFGIVQDNRIYVDDDGVVHYCVHPTGIQRIPEVHAEAFMKKSSWIIRCSPTWEQFIAKGNRVGVFSTWPIVQVGFEDVTEALNYPVLPPMTSSTNDRSL